MSDDGDLPLALDAYEQLADSYAERAPTKPFNADLERPTTQGLLPDVSGMNVLDAGCGPGITTEHLLNEGAEVTGIDASKAMLSHSRERVPNADFLRCDFGKELPFESERFDLVYSSLAFDYVEDWKSLFSELARVLRADGVLVFSSGHPIADYFYFDPENYFETEVVSAVWAGFGDPVEVPTYRRPLAAILNPLLESGFRLDRIEESQPTETFREKDPETFARVSREPTFLSVRAVMTAN
ncbi:class I SAM-dependent DNA methyltransferase [Haladaptatus caseinilyticus]|uniref:class I SAM-dependent DNA methyltransferase n=1 Tax=Haladaptatus caseinilyticus TaxID=2993314 RepID=UPI00224B0CD5|nr:class I SAM-dependent methyltransferase [Haladaptatus caseinilyticus]